MAAPRPDGLQVVITRLCRYGNPGDMKMISYSTAEQLILHGYAKKYDGSSTVITPSAPIVPPVLVTAICPTYNRRVYIPSAISQFFAQTYHNSELLIVDDSTEGVADLIPKNPRVRYIRLDVRTSLGAKRNFCCENARGEIIIHWDDDDWNGPDRIKDQVSKLGSGKSVMTYCDVLYWNEITKMSCRAFPGRFNTPHGATLCYKKSWWRTHPFEEVGLGEDTRFGRLAHSHNQLLVVGAGSNMVIRAHGVDYGDTTSLTNRGNTCETANHMGDISLPQVDVSEIPSDFFKPLLKDVPVETAEPMVVRLKGGLGNQMFQYAFGRSLSLVHNIPLLFDRYYVDHDPIRSYSLGAYDIDVNFDPATGGGRPWHPVRDLATLVFNRDVLEAPSNTVFDGWWQTEKYFNIDIIRKELSRPKGEPNEETKRLAAEIQNIENSAFVHVRRTDYVNPGGQGMTRPVSYYVEGMNIIRAQFPDTRFFIFTDDASFCHKNFPGIEVVTANKPGNGRVAGDEHWDIWLMSLCRHAVMVNSTFAWWGAWLNPRMDRIVVAPKVWWPNVATETVPDRWLKLDSAIV